MARIVVCGGGVIGLSTAMLLARDGHEVTVLEADPDTAPDDPLEAWSAWRRKGVAQFVQPHILLARFRAVCDAELPEVTPRLLAAGCVRQSFLDSAPPALAGTPRRADDDRFELVTGRRPVVESVFASLAAEEPGVTVRRGVAVRALLRGSDAAAGVPHVTGVRTSDGEEVPADLVVDASGRSTASARWLADLDGRTMPVESIDRGFAYYTRYYAGPVQPALRSPTNTPFGSFSLLACLGDNNTWSLTLFALTSDTPLKALRHPEVFERVVRASPFHAHWLDGEAISDVLPMAGNLDRRRSFVVDGEPVVTGFAAVSDAWACTNPSGGRGLSVGMVHAQALRNVVRGHLDDPAGFACAWEEATERAVAPFFADQLAADRARVEEMTALAEGRTPPPPPPTARVTAAAMRDPDLYRAVLDAGLCLAPAREALFGEEVQRRVDDVLAGVDLADPLPLPGPDRAELLRLVGA